MKGEPARLLAEVEKAYGHHVQEGWLPSDHPMEGTSLVASDGTPVIRVKSQVGQRLDVIVHELYHFKLRTAGYPVVLWLFPRELDTDTTRASIDELRIGLYDTILHFVFYPSVRSWGIDLGESLERDLKAKLERGELAKVIAPIPDGAAALTYFKWRLEIQNHELLRRLTQLMIEQGKQRGLELGERLANRVLAVGGTPSPRQAIDALVECLNVFFEKQFVFVQREWSERLLGTHRQAIAPIEIRPVAGDERRGRPGAGGIGA